MQTNYHLRIGRDDSGLARSRAARLVSLSSIGVFAAVLYFGLRPEFNKFMHSQWLFNYEGGFIRRGLLGQIVALLSGEPRAIVHLAAALVLIAIVAALTWLVASAAHALAGTSRLVLPLFLATAPFAGGYFVLDFGRTDQLNVLLLIASLLVLSQGVSPSRLMLAAPLAIVGTFVHEGFVFMCAPLVLAMLVHQGFHRRAAWPFALAYGSIIVGALVVTIAFGRPLLPPLEQWQRMAGPGAPWELENKWAMEPLYLSVGQNIRRTVKLLLKQQTLVQYALAAAYLAPATFVLLTLARRIRHCLSGNNRVLLGLTIVASLTPLSMTVLGHDFFRWIAMALFNVTLALLFALRLAPSDSVALSAREQYVALAAALWYAVGGPLAIGNAGLGPNRVLSLMRN